MNVFPLHYIAITSVELRAASSSKAVPTYSSAATISYRCVICTNRSEPGGGRSPFSTVPLFQLLFL